MEIVFGWLLVGVVISAAYPWSAWLLGRGRQDEGRLLTLLFALAFSIGILTLIMFWESVLGIPFALWTITLPYFALMFPGIYLWLRHPTLVEVPVHSDENTQLLRRFALPMLVIISAAILFNAAYWPFHKDDTLGIYHRYGLLMAETGTLVPFAGRDDAFYQAYPTQIPLAYTYAYLASGWVNEYLAKTISTLFALACLPATFVFGRMLYGERAGWLAALLLALAPTFTRWASSGYVDLPMAFLYTLSAIFAWRLWRDGRWVDALLAGITMGLAAWTKNAALLGVLFLSVWLMFVYIRRRIRLIHILLTLVSCALVAAPWYIRNIVEAGLIVPPTAWINQAQHTLAAAFIFITQPENFVLTGWIILIAVLQAVIALFRRPSESEKSFLLLLWTIPFFSFWWLFASYDPRFVLLFLPPLAVLAGSWTAHLWEQLSGTWRTRLVMPLAGIALLLGLYITWISVEYKPEILSNPVMTDGVKHSIVLGGN